MVSITVFHLLITPFFSDFLPPRNPYGEWCKISVILHFLQAIEREKLLPPILLLTVGINMASNFVLIPSLGAAGAAIATLLSEAVFAVAGFVVLMRIGYGQIGRSLCLISLISLLAAAIPSLTFNGLNLSLGIPLLLICLISLLTLIMSLRMI